MEQFSEFPRANPEAKFPIIQSSTKPDDCICTLVAVVGVKRKPIAMLVDVKLLDAIKDRIIVAGSDPMEDAAGGANQGVLWHFLLDGQPVSLVCSPPRGEPSQENERAKDLLARDLYVKDPANRMIIKAEVCRLYVYQHEVTVNVSVPKCYNNEEKCKLVKDAVLEQIEEPPQISENNYYLADIEDIVVELDGRLVDELLLRVLRKSCDCGA